MYKFYIQGDKVPKDDMAMYLQNTFRNTTSKQSSICRRSKIMENVVFG